MSARSQDRAPLLAQSQKDTNDNSGYVAPTVESAGRLTEITGTPKSTAID